MTENRGLDTGAGEQDAKDEAVRHVVDEVQSYQDGAPEETVSSELREGFDKAGVAVDERDVDGLTQDIREDRKPDTDDVDPA